MSLAKKLFLALLVILIVIQFIRPAKNQSVAAAPDDIFAIHPAANDVEQLVKTACYDCHSNNTVYPWYSNIQPVAWWLDNHIKEGKKELNFSEFGAYAPKKADHKLEEVVEHVEEKKMPLKSYTLIHSDSRLTDLQRELIISWAKATRKQIVLK